MADIAWIGLGHMGLPMARNLLAAGHLVRGFDLSEVARAAASGAGIEVAGSIAEVVEGAEAVFTCLPAGPQVRAALDGEDGVLAHVGEGALLVDTSTVDIETSRWCHEAAEQRGVEFVDAPISGGVHGATDGTLTFMTGGTDRARARVRELAEPMAGRIMDVGGPGMGVAAKICNNMMLFINVMATAEASQLAEQLGLDQQTFVDIASASSGQSWALNNWYPVPGINDSAPSNNGFAVAFPPAGAIKDVSLAVDAARRRDVAVPTAELVIARMQQLIDEGFGDYDATLVAKLSSPDGRVAGLEG